MKIWGYVPNVSKIYENANKIRKTTKVSETVAKGMNLQFRLCK